MDNLRSVFLSSLDDRTDVLEASGNAAAIRVLYSVKRDFEEAWDKYGREDQPATPAESLHEMAKRWGDDGFHGQPYDLCKSKAINTTFVRALAACQDADEIINDLRQWAAENPPKPALTGVCALCSNAEVACGNCVHNPRHVDHFHKAEQ